MLNCFKMFDFTVPLNPSTLSRVCFALPSLYFLIGVVFCDTLLTTEVCPELSFIPWVFSLKNGLPPSPWPMSFLRLNRLGPSLEGRTVDLLLCCLFILVIDDCLLSLILSADLLLERSSELPSSRACSLIYSVGSGLGDITIYLGVLFKSEFYRSMTMLRPEIPLVTDRFIFSDSFDLSMLVRLLVDLLAIVFLFFVSGLFLTSFVGLSLIS